MLFYKKKKNGVFRSEKMVIVSSMTPHGLYGLLLAKLISRHRSIQNTSLYRKKKS